MTITVQRVTYSQFSLRRAPLGWALRQAEKWPRRTLGSLGPGSAKGKKSEKKSGSESRRAVRFGSLCCLTPFFAPPFYEGWSRAKHWLPEKSKPTKVNYIRRSLLNMSVAIAKHAGMSLFIPRVDHAETNNNLHG